MRVAIIGGGAAGLCAARHIIAINNGLKCTLYEQTDTLGGTWNYTDAIGKDKHGLPIHSSMYKNLRTNLPKEVMAYPGFPMQFEKSYLTAKEVHQYLLDYAEHYHVVDCVKFEHHVEHVVPKESGWQVTVKDLVTDKIEVVDYDSVIVCNGHFSEPEMPDVPGLQWFRGKVMHSHYYRVPEPFTDQVVLIIGGGPSGIDISYDVSPFAEKVLFSHHIPELLQCEFPANVYHKPGVSSFLPDSVIFVDKTKHQIGTIIFCTGYKYTFPFLSPKCGISVQEARFTHPLYKHMINICHPTMCFIGVPFRGFIFPLFDCQVRMFVKTLTGEIQLPSAGEMLADTEADIKQRQQEGLRVKDYHVLGKRLKPYVDSLIELGSLPILPPVIYQIYSKCAEERKQILPKYRETNFEIIDDNTYRILDQ